MSESPIPTPAETPAETIRRAATLMRQRAQAATGSPWHASPVYSKDASATSGVYSHAHPAGSAESEVVASGRIKPGYGGIRRGANAEHIASWHPAVALAVAAWLDVELADMNGYFEEQDRPTVLSSGQVGWSYFEEVPNSSWTAAFVLARTYLGEVS